MGAVAGLVVSIVQSGGDNGLQPAFALYGIAAAVLIVAFTEAVRLLLHFESRLDDLADRLAEVEVQVRQSKALAAAITAAAPQPAASNSAEDDVDVEEIARGTVALDQISAQMGVNIYHDEHLKKPKAAPPTPAAKPPSKPEDTLEVTCIACQKRYRVKAEMRGRRLRCSNCNYQFVVN